jgi:hypothetical protein
MSEKNLCFSCFCFTINKTFRKPTMANDRPLHETFYRDDVLWNLGVEYGLGAKHLIKSKKSKQKACGLAIIPTASNDQMDSKTTTTASTAQQPHLSKKQLKKTKQQQRSPGMI